MEDEALISQSQPPKDDAMTDLPVSLSEDLNSDSDSDSDSEDDEAQDNLQLQTVEKELSDNPSNYDAHVRCICLLRKMGDVEKLRRAREAMSELFPLTPSMWHDWARDESALIAAGSEAFHEVEKLYERGVSDYLSVSLWRSYVDFVQEYDVSIRELSDAGISKARDLFERALTATGLHVAEGNSIWEAYREFEQAISLTVDDTDTQAKGKQVQRIRSIFQRQLSVPLVNMRSTLLSYKAWEVDQGSVLDLDAGDLDGLSSHVASTFQKAFDMYNARSQYEERISKDLPDTERFQEFKNYLKFEQLSGDPARVQILYERAITDFPVSADLWIDYARYLDRTLKIGSTVSGVHSRAIKNCPWVADLWVRYLLSLERNRASEKEIAAVYEKALQCTFSNIEEYLYLYLTRVDSLRRRIVFANDVGSGLDFSLIRETFKSASDYLTPHLKNTDSLLRLHAYWARLELNLGKNLVAAREVWETLLKNCGSMLEAWIRYISMEIELGNIKEARSLYKRCYSKRFPETGSADICHSWLRFEKEYGTLDDFDFAAQKASGRLEELELFRLREESKLAEEKEAISKKTTREKRKSISDIGDEHHPTKRQKESEKKKVQEKEKPREHDLIEVGKVEAQEQDNEKSEQTKESFLQRGRVFTDQCTVFISNLNYKATSDDLHKFFSDIGGVVAIRVLRDKFTKKSRGLAYVDFSDDAHVEAAVKKNRATLLGKILSIAKSNPKHGKRDQSSHNRQVQDKDQSSAKSMEEPAKSSSASTSTARKTRLDNIQLVGKNTFALPRNVAALSQKAMKPKTDEDKPKSNDEFRQMLPKG